MSIEKALDLVKCSFNDDGHIVENGIPLSCSHFICKKCIPNSEEPYIRCAQCDKVNKINLRLCDECELVSVFIDMHVDKFLHETKGDIAMENERLLGNINWFDHYNQILKQIFYLRTQEFHIEPS